MTNAEKYNGFALNTVQEIFAKSHPCSSLKEYNKWLNSEYKPAIQLKIGDVIIPNETETTVVVLEIGEHSIRACGFTMFVEYLEEGLTEREIAKRSDHYDFEDIECTRAIFNIKDFKHTKDGPYMFTAKPTTKRPFTEQYVPIVEKTNKTKEHKSKYPCSKDEWACIAPPKGKKQSSLVMDFMIQHMGIDPANVRELELYNVKYILTNSTPFPCLNIIFKFLYNTCSKPTDKSLDSLIDPVFPEEFVDACKKVAPKWIKEREAKWYYLQYNPFSIREMIYEGKNKWLHE